MRDLTFYACICMLIAASFYFGAFVGGTQVLRNTVILGE